MVLTGKVGVLLGPKVVGVLPLPLPLTLPLPLPNNSAVAKYDDSLRSGRRGVKRKKRIVMVMV